MATQYSPIADSSPTAEQFWTVEGPDAPEDNPGFDRHSTLILELVNGDGPTCSCGCLRTKKNARSGKAEAGFIQGHDQALKGKLIRAGRHGIEVAVAAGALISGDAATIGHHIPGLTSKGLAQIAAGIAREVKTPAADDPADRLAPTSVDGQVKVGRWFYNATRYATGEVSWTDKGGVEHQANERVTATFQASA